MRIENSEVRMADTERSIRPTTVRVILVEAIVITLLWWVGEAFGR